MTTYDPEEDWSPASWLGAFANTLYNEFLDYWELQNVPNNSQLSDDDRRYFRALMELGEALTPALHSLSAGTEIVAKVRQLFTELGVTVDVNEGFAARVARASQKHPIIRDTIRFDLALQAADFLLAGAEERAMILVGLLGDRSLSTRAAAFLDRATRLYLWGFGPEAVVMCASVLEAAYEERFHPTEMFRLQIPKHGQEYEPYEYEQAALASGVFSKDQKDLAARIRRARNDTLHSAPDTAMRADDALKKTALLLERLFPK